jgi:peptide chain release factor 2
MLLLMAYGGLFDIDCKKEKIRELDSIMANNNFWDDKETANIVIKELNEIKEIVNLVDNISVKIKNNIETCNLLITEYDDELKNIIESDLNNIDKEVSELQIKLLLDGDYDKNNCILEVHSGAGGTEACDWANMLYRMYSRWCEKNNYKLELISCQEGEEVGIKSVAILVKGTNAYGYLKNEKGVHRLVRISPFDANKKRHTSFASIDIIPDFDDDIEIEIKETDLKIDVYRSSGAGGQHVNTTDSAVRITHLPSKIVVTCQNERSQIKNRETAIKMLKNKLYKLEVDKREQALTNIKGEQRNIEFGSQIRSYVMHPYSMVKDHRTDCETSNVDKVLDGDLNMFIQESLKRGR